VGEVEEGNRVGRPGFDLLGAASPGRHHKANVREVLGKARLMLAFDWRGSDLLLPVRQRDVDMVVTGTERR
jgi:hypothetical protein